MNKEPARLGKPQEKCFTLCGKYAHIIVPVAIVVLVILIIVLIAVFVDIATAHNSTVVMVESGNYYNHLQDVI